MTSFLNCPFCDSLERRKFGRNKGEVWDNTLKVLQNYFSNFTFVHFYKLCESCFTYVQEFCKSRQQWSINEKAINEKRRLGQFKGLKDFVNLKKKSSLICRLCFKESHTEDVICIYLENQIYHPGYIQKILTLHANDMDLNITENPVICQECFNVIQTFDALYQMCLENQVGKVEPDLIIKSSGDSKKENHDTENIVHVQLKKSNNDSLVLHQVTEEESAVIGLIKNKESPSDNVLLNGWTTKNLLDLVHNQKSQKQNNENLDVCIISDEDEEVTKDNNPINSANTISAHEDLTSQNIILVSEHSRKGSTFKMNSLKSDVIEINDSDEEPVGYPKIVDVISLNDIEESQLQNDSEIGDEDIETIPTIEINMAEVSQLFKNIEEDSQLDTIISEKTESDTDSVDISFADDLSNSNSSSFMRMHSKDLLEENLSSFLQFNKYSHRNTISNSLKRCNDSNDDTTKKARLTTVIPDETDHIDKTFHDDCPKKFSSAFEQFVIIDKQPNISPWKLLRGFLFNNHQEDEYCSWFPFVSQNRKSFPSKKKRIFITVMENRSGNRLYRCNICLHVMKSELQASSHDCPKFKKKKSRICLEPKCTFYTFNEFLFSQHMKAHNLISNDSIQNFKCSFCDFFSSDKECMTYHKKKFHETGTLKGSVPKCPFCFFQSVNPDILAHHIVVRHTDQAPRKSKFTEKHYG